jgi:hypothetical protein
MTKYAPQKLKGQSHEKVGEMRVQGDILGPNHLDTSTNPDRCEFFATLGFIGVGTTEPILLLYCPRPTK